MERRLHVVIHLPNDHPAEATAFNAILGFLRVGVFLGQGYSLVKRIEGYWLSPVADTWVRDYSTLYITDVPLPTTEYATAKFTETISEIRNFALVAYHRAGRAQDEIWITSHPIDRHGDD